VIGSGTYASHSPDETEDLGRRIGESLTGATVVLLEGELGAGKTLLTRGIVAGLDADPDQVSSPTFTLVNEYTGGRLPILHLDLYRLEGSKSVAALYEIGLEEILDRNAIVVVEWAENLKGFPVPAALRIILRNTGDETREITVSSCGENAGVC